MARLTLTLLGTFNVLLGEKPLTAFESNKVRALLACLAAEPDRPQRREILATLLWPDWPQQSAMRNLSYALNDLRTILADRQANTPFLLINRSTLQLNRQSDIWVDTWVFEQFLNQKSSIDNLKSVTSLYRGPFMDGFSLPDSAPFEEWLAVRRESFLRQVVQVLRSLCEYHEERGEYDLALPYAYRQIELEAWREEAHQGIMRLLALSGQRSAALAQFDRCRDALVHGLGVEPGAETLALYERIRNGSLASRKPAAVTTPTTVAEEVILPGRPPHPAETSPLDREKRPRHNLPQQVTRFFGREGEIARIEERLGEWRLVTLTGSGGVGKTRLSLRVAESLLGDFPDGVWFVELAPLSDPELVARQVGASLGLLEDPGRPIQESLAHFIHDHRVLLVLDNCEHLLEACARLAEALLRTCPHLKILASSREPLGIGGEAVFRVPSLPFPDPEHLPDSARLKEFTAVSLLVDRARAFLPDYQVTPQNAPYLARICQRLDGIPLALELAAARMNLLSAEQLAGRLEDAFRLLTGGSRTALPRQQTLRAAIDWSYNLLSQEERLLLQRLSIFAEGCTLEAAEAVCSGVGLDADQVLDRLAALVGKSMLLADRLSGEETRYRLLEIVRQYAADKLEGAGESERLHRRHRDYYLQFAETGSPRLRTKERPAWVKRFEADQENYDVALEWSFSDPADNEAGLRLVLALAPFWEGYYFFEESRWLQKGIDVCRSGASISSSIQARLLAWGSDHVHNDIYESVNYQTGPDLAQQSLAISRSLGPEDKETLILSLTWMAHFFIQNPEEWDRAQTLLDELGSLVQSLGPKSTIDPHLYQADYGMQQADLDFKRGQDEQARTRILESIRMYQEFGWDIDLLWPYQLLGDISFRAGDYDQARINYSESLPLAIEIEHWRRGILLGLLCEIEFRQGNLEQAFAYCRDYIQIAYEAQTPANVLDRLEMSARIFARRGQVLVSARLSGAAEALSEAIGRKTSAEPYQSSFPGDWRTRFADASLDSLVPDWRARADGEAILQAWNAGREMTYDQVVAFALNEITLQAR